MSYSDVNREFKHIDNDQTPIVTFNKILDGVSGEMQAELLIKNSPDSEEQGQKKQPLIPAPPSASPFTSQFEEKKVAVEEENKFEKTDPAALVKELVQLSAPSSNPLISAISFVTLSPGKCPPMPGFAD